MKEETSTKLGELLAGRGGGGGEGRYQLKSTLPQHLLTGSDHNRSKTAHTYLPTKGMITINICGRHEHSVAGLKIDLCQTNSKKNGNYSKQKQKKTC